MPEPQVESVTGLGFGDTTAPLTSPQVANGIAVIGFEQYIPSLPLALSVTIPIWINVTDFSVKSIVLSWTSYNRLPPEKYACQFPFESCIDQAAP